MCTLSFLPSNRSFLVAMNRDESHTRPAALPPRILEVDGMEVIYPREPGGGTWVGCNDGGNLLALVNWHVAVPGCAQLGQPRPQQPAAAKLSPPAMTNRSRFMLMSP